MQGLDGPESFQDFIRRASCPLFRQEVERLVDDVVALDPIGIRTVVLNILLRDGFMTRFRELLVQQYQISQNQGVDTSQPENQPAGLTTGGDPPQATITDHVRTGDLSMPLQMEQLGFSSLAPPDDTFTDFNAYNTGNQWQGQPSGSSLGNFFPGLTIRGGQDNWPTFQNLPLPEPRPPGGDNTSLNPFQQADGGWNLIPDVTWPANDSQFDQSANFDPKDPKGKGVDRG